MSNNLSLTINVICCSSHASTLIHLIQLLKYPQNLTGHDFWQYCSQICGLFRSNVFRNHLHAIIQCQVHHYYCKKCILNYKPRERKYFETPAKNFKQYCRATNLHIQCEAKHCANELLSFTFSDCNLEQLAFNLIWPETGSCESHPRKAAA